MPFNPDPNSTFFELPEPDLMKQNIKFGIKSACYPTKYPTFWVPEPDFLEFSPYPTLPESDFLLFDTRLFATRSTTTIYE